MPSLAERYKQRTSKERTNSLLPTDMQASIKREENVITRFLEDKDLPPWYRGTSQFQNDAAQRLLNAIRDDTEQQTTFRVRHCLHVIGLEPSISAQQVELLMHLSRGNDLAFLWFVMELCYKTERPGYSVNEQLIMSCIAHLDMITTLREFDRILPSSEFSKREWERRQRWAARDAERLRAEEEEEKRAANAAAAVTVVSVDGRPLRKEELTYFQKLPRPGLYGHPLSAPMPDFLVKFPSYNLYKDPDYIPPNEVNRWYENYQLQPEKRVVNGILNDTVGEMFEDYERCLTKANKMEMLCEHHKVIREMEETLEAELNVLARDKCLDYINPDKRRQKERVERITKALDCEVKRLLNKFRAMANKSKEKMIIMNIAGDDPCQYHEVDKSEVGWLDDLDYEEEGGNKCSADTESVEYASTTQRVSVDDKRSSDTAAGMRAKRTDVGNIGSSDCQHNTPVSSNESDFMPDRNSKQRVSIADSILSILAPQQQEQQEQHADNNKCEDTLNSNGAAPSSSSTSHTYFEATTEHKPYVFHYNKVFTFKEDPSENKRLQQSIIRALLSNADLHKYVENSYMDVKKALKDCVDELWCSGVRAKNDELKEKEEANAEAERNRPPEQRGLLHYDREYFDPEDKPFMLQMVKDAIEQLKKNPRFVLASLPEAYKLPILLEWMRNRYGKRYTRAERNKLYRDSQRIYKALEKISLQVRFPKTKELGEKCFIDYSCRDYLLKKANFIKADYYRRLNASIMEQTRIFWFAMRPYLCSKGPPRNTYFAYMPASVKDIANFRIWKPSEFMNAKAQWDIRQANKRRSGNV